MTNGAAVVARVAVKPVATLRKPLDSVDLASGEVRRAHIERSDVAIIPRAAVVGEAMLAIALADALLADMGGDTIGDDPNPWLNTGTGLRPSSTETFPEFPFFDGDSSIVKNTVTWYPQKTRSTWQAEWRNGAGEEQEVIADWGDNLRSQSFNTNSVVRVEMTLVQDTSTSDASDTMTGYEMDSLEGSRRDEVMGTNAVQVQSNVRSVYTVSARIRMQKLVQQGGAVDDTVSGVDLAVADAFGVDGPGGFGAEVNVSGKVIYGYVWQLRNSGLSPTDRAGWWRITFELDPTTTIGAETIERNVTMTELDAGETGSTATLDPGGHSTSIEILVEQR